MLSIDLAYCILKLYRIVGVSSLEKEDRTEKELRRSKGMNGKLIDSKLLGGVTIKSN